MANSCGCGCYGALNCVPGPLQCGYQPAEPSYYQNYPFYNGPCPPGPGMPPCRHCPPCWWDDCAVPESDNACCTPHPVSTFAASGPIRVDEGCCVELTPSVINRDLFSVQNGEIVIRKPGAYLATYAVNLPPQHSVNTQLCLQLDGNEVPGSARSLICMSGAAAGACVTAQAIVQSGPNRTLSLRSENPIHLPCENPNLFTLTLLRIS